MRNRGWIYLLVVVCAGVSCRKENMGDCFKGVGKQITETRSTPAFNRLLLEGRVNVFIQVDSIYSVRLEGGKNLLPLIRTDVENGLLKVSNDNTCNWVRNFKTQVNVHVTVPGLVEVTSDGAGKIQGLDTLYADRFDIYMKRSGDVELLMNAREILSHIHAGGDLILSGHADIHQVHTVGNGFVHCSGLSTYFSYMWNYTTGDSYIRASEEIGVYLYAPGDVYYAGQPKKVIQENNGTGRLIPVE